MDKYQGKYNLIYLRIIHICTFSAAMCPGKKFQAKYVIHVNSPSWGDANAQSQLQTAVNNVLKLAEEKSLKTVALPSISSGK
jgi:histone H2A